MRLRYETGIATLIQFVSLTLLNVATGTVSVVSTCRDTSGNCLSNFITSLSFFLLISAWFGLVWLLGSFAQIRRSKRLCQLLIVVELLIAVVALFNARHHNDLLSLATSLIDFGLALWVIYLAYTLMKVDGGRVIKHQSRRKYVGKYIVTKQK